MLTTPLVFRHNSNFSFTVGGIDPLKKKIKVQEQLKPIETNTNFTKEPEGFEW